MTHWQEYEKQHPIERRRAAPEPAPAAEIIEAHVEPLDEHEDGADERGQDWQLPLLLFLATCVTTYQVQGWAYALPLMFILTAHELGHFLQAKRYGVATSLPYFIPMPLFRNPIGTMGAVIGMFRDQGNRRELFDIGISGPLAGLVPTLVFSVWGLYLSRVLPVIPGMRGQLGEPLLFKWLAYLIHGPIPPGSDLYLHPIAYAGWVGLLLTCINLFPIGQLDGGHIMYALLRGKAHIVGQGVLLAAIVAVTLTGLWEWTLMLTLLTVLGRTHPPTADDELPLGFGRSVLGWVTLAFIPFGFTPTPFLR